VNNNSAQTPSLMGRIKNNFSPKTKKFLNQGIKSQDEQDLVSTQDKLDVLDSVLTEVESQSQAELETLNPTRPVRSGVERAETGPDSSAVESGASLQFVEAEKTPEIPPEVDKYLKRVGKDQSQLPKKIIVADQQQDLPDQDQYQAKPVIVLPITPAVEEKGKRKSPKFSIRWLVEWSRKIVKMFAGQVIYRQNGQT
jgi:hypothetical protein